MHKMIGLVEATGSMSYKITGDAQPRSGLGKYEGKDFFLSIKGACMPADLEEVTAQLQNTCERYVMSMAEYHANFLDQPAPAAQPAPSTPEAKQETATANPEPPPAPTTPAPEPQKLGEYVVTEKAPSATTATQPTSAPVADTPATIAARLKTLGLTVDELTDTVKIYFDTLPPTTKWSKSQYIEAFAATEEHIKKHGIEVFRKGLAAALLAPPEPTTPLPAVFTEDAATIEALKQVAEKFPTWTPELIKVGALWCADHTKTAAQLDAFLVAAGITSTANQSTANTVRLESFMAITRHLSISAGTALVAYAKKSQKPVSMIEEDLGRAVGQPIRYAMELKPDAVADAFKAMSEGGK